MKNIKSLEGLEIKTEILRILNSLKPGEEIYFCDSEFGLGCDNDIANGMIDVLNIGVRIKILLGPEILIDDNKENAFLNLIEENKFFNLELFSYDDPRNSPDFHFIVSPKDILIMYPYLPSKGLEFHGGIEIKKLISDVKRRVFYPFNTYFWEWEEAFKKIFDYFSEYFAEEGIKKLLRKTKNDFAEKEKTKEFKKCYKNSIALVLKGQKIPDHLKEYIPLFK